MEGQPGNDVEAPADQNAVIARPVSTNAETSTSTNNGKGDSSQPAVPKTNQQLNEAEWCIVNAAQNINYLDPFSFDQLNSDLQTVMVVAGLLIGGTYQGLYTGYANDSSTSSYDAPFAAFCTLNLVAFGLSVVAVFLAVTGVILLQKLRRWPDDSDTVPDPPPAISSQYVDAVTFNKVEKCVKALNFVWHAHNYGILRPSVRQYIQSSFFMAWASLLLSLTLTLAAAGVALYHQVDNRKAIFGGVMGGIGGVCFVIAVVPPIVAMCRSKDDVYLKPKPRAQAAHSATGADEPSLGGPSTALSRRSGRPLLARLCEGLRIRRRASGSSRSETATNRQGILDLNWWSTQFLEHVVCGFVMRSSADFKTQVWYDAMKVAKDLDNQVKIVSRKAVELQDKLEEEHSAKIAPIMDKLDAWKQQYGLHYAVHVFLDPKLLPEALQYTRTLWTFWKQLDKGVEGKEFTLEDFFSTRSYSAVWLGRAKEYRDVAEQLDIVNWYYKNKHIQNAGGPHPHYCDNLVNVKGDALEEYHSQPQLDSGHQPVVPEDRGRSHEYGEFEEWLVKGSYCRPDRYRLIQEWEARQFLIDTQTGQYAPKNLNQVPNEQKPRSSLQLAWLLRQHLGTSVRFQDTVSWPPKLRGAPEVIEAVKLREGGPAGGADPSAAGDAVPASMVEALAGQLLLAMQQQKQQAVAAGAAAAGGDGAPAAAAGPAAGDDGAPAAAAGAAAGDDEAAAAT